MTPTKLILVDGNALGFWAYTANRLSAGGRETQGVFNLIKKLRALLVEHPEARVLFTWDGDSWRKKANAAYKANREDTPESRKMRDGYRAQKPLMMRAVNYLGVRQLSARNLEADDLIAMMARKASASSRTMIVSGDRDLIQCVSPHVYWKDPKTDRTVTHHNFAEETGFNDTAAYIQGKALIGDTGDHLKGVDGVGEKCAQLLLAEFGDTLNAVMAIREGKPLPASLSRFNKKLTAFAGVLGEFASEGLQTYLANIQLMDLNAASVPKAEGLRNVEGLLSKARFAALCEELHFASILKQMDEWMAPFEAAAGPRKS